ncbi:hypothetical protein ACN3XK_74060, partial [Actinomadura welshii]
PTPGALAEHIAAELAPPAGGEADVEGGVEGDEEGGVEGEEGEVRALLASVPLARLREIGVLEPLLALAGRNGGDSNGGDFNGGHSNGGAESGDGESIDEMGVEDLVRAALNGTDRVRQDGADE